MCPAGISDLSRPRTHYISIADVLDTLEARHDWAKMVFTPKLFKYVFTQMIPEVIFHTQNQDEEQVRDTYDSE